MSDQQRRELELQIRDALTSKSWTLGLELTEQWCRTYPKSPAGWYWRSGCLLSLNRWAEALGCARKAAAFDPTSERIAALVSRLETRLAPAARQSQPPAAQPPAAQPPAAQPPVTLLDEGQARPVEEPQPQPVPAARPVSELSSQPTKVISPEPPPTLEDEPQQAPVPQPHPAREPEPAAAVPPTSSDGTGTWRIGALIEERFEVREVARGGMGEVYFVFDRELGLMIAVKTPLPETLETPAGRARFFREAEAWIALGLHPNICSAYYVREIGGLPRLFIEFVEGWSLADWLAQSPGSELGQRLDLAIQIAAGMHHAHTFSWQDEDGNERRGLVHRDLKPANVLLTSQLEARVTDFGLVGRGGEAVNGATGEAPDAAIEAARHQPPGQGASSAPEPLPVQVPALATQSVWGTMTLGGVAIGTPPYMPPEQWLGAHHAGPAADIYAFGCILYELVCGKRPLVPGASFAKARPEAVLMEWRRLHCDVEPIRPIEHVPDIDAGLAALIQRCLAKDPGDRPSGFDEIGAELRQVYQRLGGTPYPREEPRPGRLLAGSLNNRGVSFAALGQAHRAEQAWRQALAAGPHHIEATYNLALFEWRHRGLGDHEVLARMDEVRQTQMAMWRDEHLAAKLQLVLGAYDEAQTCLEQAMAAAPDVPDVLRDAALAAAAVARSSSSGRADAWARALELAESRAVTDDPALLVARACALAEHDRLEEAQELYDRARRLRPGLPEALSVGAARLVPGQQLIRRTGGFGGRAQSIAMSGDGRIALLRGDEGRFTIFDLGGGEVVRTYRNPSGKPIRCLSIDAAGTHGMTVAEGEAVLIWRLEAGAPVRRLQIHAGYLNALATSPGCKTVAAVGSDGGLTIWDYQSGRRLLTFRAHEGFGLCVAVAPDHRTIVTGGSDTVLKVSRIGADVLSDAGDAGDAGEPQPDHSSTDPQSPVQAVLSGHTAPVTAVALDQTGRWIISGAEDGELRLWSLDDGQCRGVLGGHAGAVRWVSFDARATRAASAAADGTVRLWNLKDREPVAAMRFEGLLGGAAGLPDLSSVVVVHGSELSQLDLRETPEYWPSWAVAVPVSVSEAQQRESEFRARLGEVRRRITAGDLLGAFEMVDHARVISGYEREPEALALREGLAACFPRTGLGSAWEARCFDGHLGEARQGKVSAAAMVPGTTTLVSAGVDRALLLWAWDTGEVVRELERGQRQELALAVAPSGELVLVAGADHALRVWRLGDGACTQTILGNEAQVHAVAISPRESHAVAAGADETARIWDLATGGYTAVLSGHLAAVTAAAWSPDGEHVVTGAANGTVVLWDPRSGVSLRALEGHSGRVSAIAWLGGGTRIVTAGSDGTVRLWDPGSGECRQRFEVQGEVLTAVAVSPDDQFLISGSDRGVVRLFNIAAGTEERSFTGHTAAIVAVGFSDNGFRAFSASRDGSIRVWYLDWKVAACEPADWDERARPWLEVFLARRTPRRADGAGAARARWTRQDVETLMADLRQRGMGWLRRDGVEAELRRMAGRTTDEAPARARATVAPTAVVTPGQARQRQTLVRLGIVAVIALIPLLIIGNRSLQRSRLRVEARQVEQTRAGIRRGVMPLRQMATGRAPCVEAEHDAYLDAYLGRAGDIRYDPVEAMICLAMVGDTRTVRPLLDSLRPRERELRLDGVRDIRGSGSRGEIGSILVFLNETTIAVQERALSDPEPAVRDVVATALAARGSERSISALMRHAFDDDPAPRETIAPHFREIVASGVLSPEQALDLAARWARDPSVEVRQSLASKLGILAGSRVDALAEQLAQDSDDQVRAAARRLLSSRR